jgi:hypothetical protein
VQVIGTLTVSAQVSVSGVLQVLGNLTLSSTASLVIKSGGAPINVSGCATLAGTLTLSASTMATSQKVLTYSCATGTFSSVTATTGDPCQSVTTRAQYLATEMSVAFDFLNTCTSAPPVSLIDGVDPGVAYFIVIGIPIIVALAIILAVIFGVPSIRQKVLPYRDRKHYAFSKKPSAT